jgi:hypothetical protein
MTNRDKYLMSKYGISEKQYLDQLKKQNSSCAICKKHRNNFSYNLHVDHNHKSGKVRGLLCYYCNKFRVGRHDLASAEALYAYMVEFET